MKEKNNLKAVREDMMMSKAEVARLSGLSVLTIDRIEKGFPCRYITKRKILTALGFPTLREGRDAVFPKEVTSDNN